MQYTHVYVQDIINDFSFLFSSQFKPPKLTKPLILEPDDCKYYDVFIEELMNWVIQNDPKKYIKFDIYFDYKPNDYATQETKLRLISFNPKSGSNETYTDTVWKLPYDKTVNVLNKDSTGARVKHSSAKFLPVYAEQLLPYIYLMLGTSAVVQSNLFGRRFLFSLTSGSANSYYNGGDDPITPYMLTSKLYSTFSGIAVIPAQAGKINEVTSGNLLAELLHFNTTTRTKGQLLTQQSPNTGIFGGVDYVQSSDATQALFITKMQNKQFDFNSFLYPDVTKGELTDYSLDKDIAQPTMMLLEKIRILHGNNTIYDYLIFSRMFRATLSDLFYLLVSTRRAFVDEGISTLLINMLRPVRPVALKTENNDLLIMDCIQGKFKGKADADAVLNKYCILDSSGEKFNFTRFICKTLHNIFHDTSRVLVTDYRFNILLDVTIPDTLSEVYGIISDKVHYISSDNQYKTYNITTRVITVEDWVLLGYSDFVGAEGSTKLILPGTKTVIKDTHSATPVSASDLDQYTGLKTSVERYAYMHPRTTYELDIFNAGIYAASSIPRGTLKVGGYPGGDIVEYYNTRRHYTSGKNIYGDAFVLDVNNDLYANEVFNICSDDGTSPYRSPIFDTTYYTRENLIFSPGLESGGAGIDVYETYGMHEPMGLPLNARYPELISVTGTAIYQSASPARQFSFSYDIPVSSQGNTEFPWTINYNEYTATQRVELTCGTMYKFYDVGIFGGDLVPTIGDVLPSKGIQEIGLNYKKLFKFEHPELPTSNLIMRFMSYFPYKLGLNMELNEYLNSNILTAFQEPGLANHNQIDYAGTKNTNENTAGNRLHDLYLHEEFLIVGDPYTSLAAYKAGNLTPLTNEYKFTFNGIAPITWTIKGGGQSKVTPVLTTTNGYVAKIKPNNDHRNFYIEAQDQFLIKKLDERVGHQDDTKNRKEFYRCKIWPRTLPLRGTINPALALKFGFINTGWSNTISVTSSDTSILSVSTTSNYPNGALLTCAYLSVFNAKAKGQVTLTITHTRVTGESYSKTHTVYVWTVTGLPTTNQVSVGSTYNLSIDGTSSYPHQWKVSDPSVASLLVDKTDTKNCQLTILKSGTFWIAVNDSAEIPWTSSLITAS